MKRKLAILLLALVTACFLYAWEVPAGEKVTIIRVDSIGSTSASEKDKTDVFGQPWGLQRAFKVTEYSFDGVIRNYFVANTNSKDIAMPNLREGIYELMLLTGRCANDPIKATIKGYLKKIIVTFDLDNCSKSIAFYK